MNTISIESPIIDRKGNETTVYRLMSRIIGSRLRKRYDDGPDRDDAAQIAMSHAWQRFTELATSKPELTIEERAVLAARYGAWRTDRPVTIEPRPFRYVDALDYVSPDCDLFHLPSHAGRQRYWLMTVSESVELPAKERDAMIAKLPAKLRPYATLAAQGRTQRKIADGLGECLDTVVRRMRAVKSAIADMISEREIELARLSDGWRECCGLEPINTGETEATTEAIRECNDHACLVVETDRAPAAEPMGLPITLEGSEPRTPSHIVADIDDIKRVARPATTEPVTEPVTYWESPYLDYVRSGAALRAASSWTMWK